MASHIMHMVLAVMRVNGACPLWLLAVSVCVPSVRVCVCSRLKYLPMCLLPAYLQKHLTGIIPHHLAQVDTVVC